MTYVADPVGAGIVASLPHPGGNVTGLSSMAAQETAGKQVELLSEAVPSAARFAVLADAEPFGRLLLEQTVRAGTLRRIEIVPSVISAATELDAAIAALAERKPDGLIIQGFLSSPQLTALALRYRLPSVSQHPAFARQGGLIGHFASPNDNIRRAAVFVDKILKGANPADLPVEQPTKFELVINLKTAKALGLTVPQSLLARADGVIE
jgi:putative ABC transport system substrate-binding protein